MAASEAAVTAVMETLGCEQDVSFTGNRYCVTHNFAWLHDVDACPRAERVANAAVDADRASIQAETLREAAADADPWDDLHAAASWIMARADRIEVPRG